MFSEKPISAEKFGKLSPKAQGYWWQKQAHWNKDIPPSCPYPCQSESFKEFQIGSDMAITDSEGSMEALG